MNSAPLNDCGCGEGVEPQTPAPIANPSGLSAIAYRCGTHAQFKRTMLAALSGSTHPALAGLATRDNDDFSIALLDAWATTADVLTFYQERIAQESYLRTATERVSLLQLGRLIGYELRPGVAASTCLAFTLETAPGAPDVVTVDVGSKVQSIPGPGEKPQIFETIEKIEARPEWNEMRPRLTAPVSVDAAMTVVHLEGTGTNLRKGDMLLFLGREVSGATRAWDLCRVADVELEVEKKRTRVALNNGPIHFPGVAGADVQVFAMRLRAALFGYNAPDRRVLPDTTLAKFDAASVLEISSGGATGGLGGVEIALGPQDWKFKVSGNTVDLDTVYPAITVGSWIALSTSSRSVLARVTAAGETGRTDYTLTGKVTRLTVEVVANPEGTTIADFGGSALRGTSVLGDSQELRLAAAPVPPTLSGTTIVVAQRIEQFRRDRKLAITGTMPVTRESFSGIFSVVTTERAGDFTTLTVAPELPELEVESVRINANVARATHGETVGEILGSGDAAQPFQSFVLRQPPLTFVRAAGATGAKSTLEVRVNDLLWHEVPTLFGRAHDERVYVIRTGEDGTTTVQFGDGLTGARLPTGQDNVRATYRRGIGVEGKVSAGQLSLLLTRPLGVKSAVNPVAGAGAADREQLGDARRNAPLTVLTLDRIVSLQDYEDFVRAFAGVAKAFATWTWDGETRGVFVTVAGPGGDEIDLTGEFGRDLLESIHQASVPGVSVRVQSYRKAAGLFTLSARVKVDPEHQTDRVLAAVRSKLETQFAFEARAFGQPVHLSEVIAVIHSAPGVTAVDVDDLRRLAPAVSFTAIGSRFTSAHSRFSRLNLAVDTLEASSLAAISRGLRTVRPSSRLLAAVPQAGARGQIAPAELLVLAPLAPEQITAMS